MRRLRTDPTDAPPLLLPLASPFLSLNLSGNNRIPAQIMARIQRELRKWRHLAPAEVRLPV